MVVVTLGMAHDRLFAPVLRDFEDGRQLIFGGPHRPSSVGKTILQRSIEKDVNNLVGSHQ